jgi:predicted nucleic acid-binding protein
VIVVDASVALAWCLKDEESDYADAALEAVVADGAVVPGHWVFELGNGLLNAVRRERIELDDVSEVRTLIGRLGIDIVSADVSTALGSVVVRARDHELSAYDAAYLDLAGTRRLALATLDTRLRGACNEAGVKLFE